MDKTLNAENSRGDQRDGLVKALVPALETKKQIVNNQVQYAFTGSTAVMLLLNADSCSHVKVDDDGCITSKEETILEFPESVSSYRRAMKDIDYIYFGDYRPLMKGTKSSFDPFKAHTADLLLVKIGEYDIVIAHPVDITAFKLVQIMESFSSRGTQTRSKWLADGKALLDICNQNGLQGQLIEKINTIIYKYGPGFSIDFGEEFLTSEPGGFIFEVVSDIIKGLDLDDWLDDPVLKYIALDCALIFRGMSEDLVSKAVKIIEHNKTLFERNIKISPTDANWQILIELVKENSPYLSDTIKSDVLGKLKGIDIESIDDPFQPLRSYPYLLDNIPTQGEVKWADLYVTTNYFLRSIREILMNNTYSEARKSELLSLVGMLVTKCNDITCLDLIESIDKYQFTGGDDEISFLMSLIEKNESFKLDMIKVYKKEELDKRPVEEPAGWDNI
ncbi:MAG: hypothetical protein Kow0081_4030 [Candidatus Dojkabacteria bacterium]